MQRTCDSPTHTERTKLMATKKSKATRRAKPGGKTPKAYVGKKLRPPKVTYEGIESGPRLAELKHRISEALEEHRSDVFQGEDTLTLQIKRDQHG